MKIGIDCRMKYGVGTILKNIVPLIAKSVDKVFLLGDEKEISTWNFYSDNYQIVNFPYRVYSPKEQIFFPRKILDITDVFHCPHFNIPLFQFGKAKLVTTINDLIHLSDAMRANWWQKKYVRYYVKEALTKSSHIITLSQYSKQDILNQFSIEPKKISVVHCGVNRKIFKIRSEAEFQDLAMNLHLNEKYILVTASIRPHKNLAGLLKAFTILKKQFKLPHKLIVVGQLKGFRLKVEDFSIDDELESEIIFTGYLSDEKVAVLYSFCEVFVFPSLYEGFGLPPLEAMACGAPVICSNNTSLPEVVGKAGLLVDPFDIKSMVDSILHIVLNKQVKNIMHRKSIEQASNFSWEMCCNKYLEVYRSQLSLNN